MKKTTILAAIVASSTALTAFAHGGATGIVKDRMDAMAEMGKAVKAVTPMMRGEAAYDADVLRQAAATFSRHAGEAMTQLFPEGTGGAPSEAKETVWTQWEEFSELAERLGVIAEGLAGAADNGLMSSNGGAGMMGNGAMMGNSAMMGGGAMMDGGMMTAEQIASMPADGAFTMVTQVCSACHAKFRTESQ